ncbi:MAG: TIGR03905 family TSCPD domain-containing protein [Firmicutes bacterium]|nr:TIGR03905 family TSCPD domain-containing protein [Bacillota bacterium]
MTYDYQTEGTCSQIIRFDLEDGRVSNIRFFGGCDGNLKAISALVDGWTVDEIADKLSGIECGPRPTSCGDQLARAVRMAAAEEAKRQ